LKTGATREPEGARGGASQITSPLKYTANDLDDIERSITTETRVYGVGGLYVARRFLNPASFPVAGWWSVRDPEAVANDRLDLKETAAALEVGCPHFAGIFALGAALRLFEEIGASRIEERIHELTDYLHQQLQAARFNIASPLNREHRSGITIVEMRNAPDVAKRLAERKIIVSARGKGLRVSVHIFNNFDDIDRLIAGLREPPRDG